MVTGDKDFHIEDVNRNTQEALNALENNLDLQELSERKRMTELFGKYVNAEIHRISNANKWDDGDWQKIVLHAASGAIQGKLSGGNISAGALTGAVSEAVNGAITKYNAMHPDKQPLSSDAHQWLSAALGAIIGKATGDTIGTQAAIAASATKNNHGLFDLPEFRKSIKENEQVNNIPVGTALLVSYGVGKKGVGVNEQAIIFNLGGKYKNLVFTSNALSLGFSIDTGVVTALGRGTLFDPDGKVVTDPETIIRQLSGASISGGFIMLGKAELSINENGYTFKIYSLFSGAEVGIGISYAKFLGVQGSL